MTQNGSVGPLKGRRISLIGMTGVLVLQLPITLCLMLLFLLGGLASVLWLGLIHLVWLVLFTALKLAVRLLLWLNTTASVKRAQRLVRLLEKDGVTSRLVIWIAMGLTVVTMWTLLTTFLMS